MKLFPFFPFLLFSPSPIQNSGMEFGVNRLIAGTPDQIRRSSEIPFPLSFPFFFPFFSPRRHDQRLAIRTDRRAPAEIDGRRVGVLSSFSPFPPPSPLSRQTSTNSCSGLVKTRYLNLGVEVRESLAPEA